MSFKREKELETGVQMLGEKITALLRSLIFFTKKWLVIL